jgi:hypothetical protein
VISGHVERHVFDEQRPPYSMTKKGLRIELHLMPSDAEQYTAPIDCSISNDGISVQLALILINTTRHQYRRTAGYRTFPTTILAYKQRDFKRYGVRVPQSDEEEVRRCSEAFPEAGVLISSSVGSGVWLSGGETVQASW